MFSAKLPPIQPEATEFAGINLPPIEYISLFEKLLVARGPSGNEIEVREICVQELNKWCDEVRIDRAGNVVGFMRGNNSKYPICVMAHMDELSYIIKSVQEDGTIKVDPLGSIEPANYGQGPVEILTLNGAVVPAIMSFGSMHVTPASPAWETKSSGGQKNVDWSRHAFLFTGYSREEAFSLGVVPGAKVVIAKERRVLSKLNEHLSSYFIDNRGLITSALKSAEMLSSNKELLNRDVYFVFNGGEEFMDLGSGGYFIKGLQDSTMIALDIVPVAEEYNIELSAHPVVLFKDGVGLHTHEVCQDLLEAGRRIGIECRSAVISSYRSDASSALRYGMVARSALFGISTLNTHGCEIIHQDSIPYHSRVLTEFIQNMQS